MSAFRHYSAEPFELDRSRAYEQGGRGKPTGFWISVLGEDDWPSWCRSEEFRLDTLAAEHEVILAESANILTLASHAEIVEFTTTHGYTPDYYRDEPMLSTIRDYGIRWPDVAALYDGIVVAPYQWHSRWEFMWYSGWDCASGCVWNLDAIAEISLITEGARS